MLTGDFSRFKNYKEGYDKFIAISKIAVKQGEQIFTSCTNILTKPSIYTSIKEKLAGKMDDFEKSSITIINFGEYLRCETTEGDKAHKTEIAELVERHQKFEKKVHDKYEQALMVGIEAEVEDRDRARNERGEQAPRGAQGES